MNNISWYLAFFAGVLSFLSPCVLPLVPAYISYLTGSTISELNENKDRIRTISKAVGFVIGFSIIFIAMFASFSVLGQFLVRNKEVFRKISGVLIFLLGIHMTGLIKFKFLYYEKRALPLHKLNQNFGPVVVGMAFAAGWTPCIGPVLSGIVAYASNMDTFGKGLVFLMFYSLGLAVPFIATAAGISKFSLFFKRMSKYMSIVSIASGLLLILMGIIIYRNGLGFFSQYLNFINFY